MNHHSKKQKFLKSSILLKSEFSNYDLSWQNVPKINSNVLKVKHELRKRGLKYFWPTIFVGSEWYSPEDLNSIAIPFYLLNSELLELEKKMIGEAEGEQPKAFLKLLRHEVGHAFEHAYRLNRLPKWQALFGDPNAKYNPHSYTYKAYSRKFARNLSGCYGQVHPSEDFAESFAVWLTPRTNWRKKYRSSPVILNKLKYIDSLVAKLKDKRPLRETKDLHLQDELLSSNLETLYRSRIRELGKESQFYFDRDLKKIFVETTSSKKMALPADIWLKKNSQILTEKTKSDIQVPKYAIEAEVKRFYQRLKVLKLYQVHKDEVARRELQRVLCDSLLKTWKV
ncbi:MAG: putative zinc-binding metallopeptidase [Oligoflexales bacterium]|nr:putative zinc-binding metallopeptidase [Oligoflexales bacterium]